MSFCNLYNHQFVKSQIYFFYPLNMFFVLLKSYAECGTYSSSLIYYPRTIIQSFIFIYQNTKLTFFLLLFFGLIKTMNLKPLNR